MNAPVMPPRTALPVAHSAGGFPLSGLLSVLFEEAPRLLAEGDVRLFGVRQDSRRVEPGDLFVARSGGKVSGASYAQAAAERGAVALIVERGAPLPTLSNSLPMIEVADARRSLALAAEAV